MSKHGFTQTLAFPSLIEAQDWALENDVTYASIRVTKRRGKTKNVHLALWSPGDLTCEEDIVLAFVNAEKKRARRRLAWQPAVSFPIAIIGSTIILSLFFWLTPVHAQTTEHQNPPDQAALVSQAMAQASDATDIARNEATGLQDRLSRPTALEIYARYHGNGSAQQLAKAKPCDHPVVTEAGGLCIPPPAPH